MLAASLALALLAQPADSWPMLARDAAHSSLASFPAPALTAPRWRLTRDNLNRPVQFVSHTGVAAFDNKVCAIGLISGADHLLCADALSGQCLWTQPITPALFDSWSCPSIDIVNGVVIVASGNTIAAFDLSTGLPRWQTPLPFDIVNASPCLTTDRGSSNRLFITDYAPFSLDGSLWCINIDPFHPTSNPFQPGDIVWSTPIGSTSGNTPAYANGTVYVSTVGDFSVGPGRILAFDADSLTPPEPLWTFTNVKPRGFFGGVAVAATPQGPALYAASYSFFGGQTSANLVKLDATTGNLLWSVDSNRTATIPVVAGDRIALSTGLLGFGSAPGVQFFADLGNTALRLWDSAYDTWVDADRDTQLDPGEFLSVGGWTNQPALFSNSLLAVGAMSASGQLFEPYASILILDLARAPSHPAFVAAQSSFGGNSPAAAGGLIFSVGNEGLAAFGAPLPAYDVNHDGDIDIDDLYDWHASIGSRDVNRDGAVTPADSALLESHLREGELEDMIAGRRP